MKRSTSSSSKESSYANDDPIIFGVGESTSYQILKESNSTHLIIDPSKYSKYKVISISCGGDFLFLLLQDKVTLQNRLFSAGYNGTGMLLSIHILLIFCKLCNHLIFVMIQYYNRRTRSTN